MSGDLRIAIGGVYHETNTFAAGETTASGFRAYQYFTGDDVRSMGATRSEMGGFLSGLDERGSLIVPTTYAAAVPSATVSHSTFATLRDRILAGIEAAPVDGVLLTLHGAMVTDESGDPDGDLVAAVVDLVGPDVPVVVTIDLHANVSEAMVTGVDALVAYDTYPHIDMFERGREGAELLDAVLRQNRRRSVAHRKLPFMTAPGMQATDGDPMRDILRLAHRLENETGAQISLAPGFSYADVDCTGFSVIVSDWDSEAANQIADEVAAFVDASKERFVYESLSIADACRSAVAAESTPVILVDAADNIGGGAPGDGVEILREWLRIGGTGLVTTIADPESANAAADAGIGAELELVLGAKVDDQHGESLSVHATVIEVTDGTYTHAGTYNNGYHVSMGRTAILDIAGNTAVVSEVKAMPFDAQQLLSQGIDPASAGAIIVKSAIAWQAAYGDVAGIVIDVDAPGICTSNLERLAWSPDRARMLPTWTSASVRTLPSLNDEES